VEWLPASPRYLFSHLIKQAMKFIEICWLDRQTDRQTDRETDRHTGR
jgi:hypothetical protein